jgi:hypothetical protein
VCAVALLGVWNWRGTNERGGKAALSDWESVALNDRRVLLAFDSDALVKRSVHQALERLAGFLEGRGAVVLFVYLPELEHGGKCGVDDYLANGGTVASELVPAIGVLPADYREIVDPVAPRPATFYARSQLQMPPGCARELRTPPGRGHPPRLFNAQRDGPAAARRGTRPRQRPPMARRRPRGRAAGGAGRSGRCVTYRRRTARRARLSRSPVVWV